MKYKKGQRINGRQAIVRMLDGEIVFRNVLPARIDENGQFQALDRGVWIDVAVSRYSFYYEAIPESEYDLTFMEAWEEMKKGKTVERDDELRFHFRSPYAYNQCGAILSASTGVMDSKYRVVDPA